MLPNLLVVGAQKAGTTSLHRYLDLHPQIAMSRRKELDFFAGPGWEWERGVAWYESHFTREATVIGESSPSYSAFPWVRGVPERVHSLIPDVKLIYLVRDPVDRMVSEYLHYRAVGNEKRPIETVFSHPRMSDSGYVAKGRYHMQLDRYLALFPRERILILAHEDLLDHREATLRRVFRFLGVDESFYSPGFGLTHNRAAEKPGASRPQRALARALGPRLSEALKGRASIVRRARREGLDARPAPPIQVNPSLRSRLGEHFVDDATLLRRLTGERYESWCV